MLRGRHLLLCHVWSVVACLCCLIPDSTVCLVSWFLWRPPDSCALCWQLLAAQRPDVDVEGGTVAEAASTFDETDP